MGKVQLNESEKKLLTVIGKYPHLPMKDLVTHTPYKRVSSVARKIVEFKKQGVLCGPFYDIDYSKLCKNPFFLLNCILESNQSYKTIISYLQLIEPLRVVYPVLSPHKELLNVLFLSSDNTEMKALLNLLKDSNIITDYIIRVYSHNKVIENPNFFGDIAPSLDNILEPCKIPDLSFGHHDTDWNQCDMNVLFYLVTGHKSTKLIEILKAERNQNRTWSYEQIKYAHKKMLKSKLIKKTYFIWPFPRDQCTDFNLFLKAETPELTQRILCNLARGSRAYREYALCEDWGFMGFTSHPLFLTGLMGKLDKIDEIKEKELYQLRSTPDKDYILVQPPEFKYFDFENQTLKYPYQVYKEKIAEKIESESFL